MAYQLQSMLRIRNMREDRAQTELAGARLARRQAESLRDRKRETRQRFETTKEARRSVLFDGVIGKVVSRQDIELVREAVTRIDEEGVLLEQDERRAEDEVKAKEAAEEASHEAYVSAAKERMKIDEHRKMWEEEDRKMREALADAEMEEFTGRKQEADDDDSLD